MLGKIRFVVALAALCGSAYADPAPAHVEGQGWVVHATRVGDSVGVELTARGAFHLNDDYPIHFDVATDPHIAYATKRIEHDAIRRAACSDKTHFCTATLQVPFKPSGAGHAGGTLAFAACDADRCVIEKIAVSVAVAAQK